MLNRVHITVHVTVHITVHIIVHITVNITDHIIAHIIVHIIIRTSVTPGQCPIQVLAADKLVNLYWHSTDCVINIRDECVINMRDEFVINRLITEGSYHLVLIKIFLHLDGRSLTACAKVHCASDNLSYSSSQDFY